MSACSQHAGSAATAGIFGISKRVTFDSAYSASTKVSILVSSTSSIGTLSSTALSVTSSSTSTTSGVSTVSSGSSTSFSASGSSTLELVDYELTIKLLSSSVTTYTYVPTVFGPVGLTVDANFGAISIVGTIVVSSFFDHSSTSRHLERVRYVGGSPGWGRGVRHCCVTVSRWCLMV